MDLSSYNLNLITAVLLMRIVAVIASEYCESYECKMHELSKLFEEALAKSGDALWQLQ